MKMLSFLFFKICLSFLIFHDLSSIEKQKRVEKLFLQYCNACHQNRGNSILPEKNLQEELKTFGMNHQEALVYQIRNGKNRMPAFELRLKKAEIEEIAEYLNSANE